MEGEERKEAVEAWPELVDFTAAMRARLDEKAPDRAKSWKDANPESLFDALAVHYEKLYLKIRKEDPANIRKKAVDLANLAMMIYNVAETAGMSRDIITDFVKDHCVIDPDAKTSFRDIYNRFCLWYQSEVAGVPLGAGWFSAHFPERFDKSTEKGKIFYSGVSLVRACRVCGCTDDDCSGCIGRTGEPCTWVEEDLCSACVAAGNGNQAEKEGGNK